jgi:hypothetical protein
MKYKELEEKILDRADGLDLLVESNLLAQSNRVKVEVDNLHAATLAKSRGFKEFIINDNKIAKTEEEIKKRLGKVLYELVILSEVNRVSLEDCLEEVYKNKR